MKITSKVNYNVIVEPGIQKRRVPRTLAQKLAEKKYGAFYVREGQRKVPIKKGEGNYNFDLSNQLVYEQIHAMAVAKQIVCDPPLEAWEVYVVRKSNKGSKGAERSDPGNKSRGKVSKTVSAKKNQTDNELHTPEKQGKGSLEGS